MCGITGFFLKKTLSDNFKSDHLIYQMTNSLFHRGPDSGEIYINLKKQFFLGHRRLSIIDLSQQACQPMTSFNKRYVIAFNGEIYNYKNVSKKLQLNANEIKSDSRVLIEAISRWGLTKTLNEINGMFAFAIWDKEEESIRLVTDHLSKKPLYWINNKNIFAFGSELKALKIIPNFDKTISLDSINEYLCSGFISSPKTIYSNVYKLGISQILTIKLNDDPTITNYKTSCNKSKTSINSNNYFQSFKSIFSCAVKDRMISDVPIGSFLSGGLDSSLVTYYAQKFSKSNIETFTVGFGEKDYDEFKSSRKVSGFLNTNHNEILIKEDDFLNLIFKNDDVFDEPFFDPSFIPTVMLSSVAKSKVKVILSGDGGDELFAGYRRHKLAYFHSILLSKFNSKMIELISKNFWKFLVNFLFSINKQSLLLKNEQLILTIQKLLVGLSSENTSNLYSNSLSKNSNPVFFNELSFNNSYSLINEISFNKNISSLKNLLNWDLNYYLPNNINVKIDRASMSHGIEVRSPFMDQRLISLSQTLPINYKINAFSNKLLLRQLSKKLFPKNINLQNKRPFSIPIGKWLKKELNFYSYDLITNGKLIELGYFSKKDINNVFKLHIEGKRNYEEFIWNITMFEKWMKKNS